MSVDGVTVTFDGRHALYDVGFEADAGTTTAVIGPNGSGKSTLLQAIAGVVPPVTGKIRTTARPALVLQSTEVDRAVPITVRDAVAMARYPQLGLFRRFRVEDRDAVRRSLERLGVQDLASRQLHDLSGGQRQRVLVAQGLAQESELLLLDEPLNGLDLPTQEQILSEIDAERDAGRTVLMTTHSLDDARRCDQVLLLATRVIAVGTPDDVVTEPLLREAFGGAVRSGGELILDEPHRHGH